MGGLYRGVISDIGGDTGGLDFSLCVSNLSGVVY